MSSALWNRLVNLISGKKPLVFFFPVACIARAFSELCAFEHLHLWYIWLEHFPSCFRHFLILPFSHWDLELHLDILKESLLLGAPSFQLKRGWACLLALWKSRCLIRSWQKFAFDWIQAVGDPFSFCAAEVNSWVLAADEIQGYRSKQQDIFWQKYSQHVHGLCGKPDQICRGTGRRNPRRGWSRNQWGYKTTS